MNYHRQDCDVTDVRDLKLEDVSIVAFFLGNPARLKVELEDTNKWLFEKGIPRLRDHFQKQFDGLVFQI